MSGVIDTNILLYAVNSASAEHSAARAFLDGALRSAEAWFLSDGIVYEFLRVATHPKVFPKPLEWKQALQFVVPICESDNFQMLSSSRQHWSILGDVLSGLTYPSGNSFFDIRTAVLMREHGVRRVYTADSDFLQFSGLEVVNPLRRAA